MKIARLLAPLCASLALSAQAQVGTPLNSQAVIPAGAPVVVEIGLHHRVWQTTSVDESGNTNVSSFTELATGLNYWNHDSCQFEESNPAFEITKDGFAISGRGQHSVILSPNLNTAEGVIDFQTPDGQRMRSGIIGLNLFDPVSGRSLQIASVTNSIGQQTAPNEITYFDAFDTLRASVRIKNERGQFHQDVLLEERVSSEQLAALGFDARSARVEVWTAFFEAPVPTIREVVLKSETNAVVRAAMVEPDEVDQIFNFGGVMQMPTGKAFVDGTDGGKDVRVFKQWMQTPDGKKYLVEAASYSELKPLLDTLPMAKVVDPNGPLLAGHLEQRTTFPPIVLTNNFTVNTTLSPQAPRETSSPDLGYAYVPLDYVVNGRVLTNTLVLTNGVALGTYGASSSYGVSIGNNGKVVSEGSPTSLNWIVRYNTVQEQATTNGSASSVAPAIKVAVDSAQAQFRFTAWSVLGGSGDPFNATIIATNAPWFTDCQFAGGTFTMTPCSVGLTNCLWKRVSLTLRDEGYDTAWYLYNNLLRGGKLTYKMVGSSPVGVAYDNLFDQTTIFKQSGSDNFTHGYNGYVTNQNRLTPNGTGDKILTNNPVYLTNWLGTFYYPTNDGMLSLLLNTGSRTGDLHLSKHLQATLRRFQRYFDMAVVIVG